HARQKRRRLTERHRAQLPAQRIDDAVECLVRHRFPLVATTRQQEAALLLAVVCEPPDERALAYARLAGDAHDAGFATAGRGEGRAQHVELGRPSDEDLGIAAVTRRRDLRTRTVAEPLEDLFGPWTSRRIGGQQAQAQILQVVRKVADERAGRRRRQTLLLDD